MSNDTDINHLRVINKSYALKIILCKNFAEEGTNLDNSSLFYYKE